MALNKEKPVADDNRTKKWSFDPTINLGHVLTFATTIFTLVVALIVNWNVVNNRLTIVEKDQAFQRERDQNQDNTSASKYIEFKELLTKIDRAVEDVRRDQLNNSRRSPP